MVGAGPEDLRGAGEEGETFLGSGLEGDPGPPEEELRDEVRGFFGDGRGDPGLMAEEFVGVGEGMGLLGEAMEGREPPVEEESDEDEERGLSVLMEVPGTVGFLGC